MPPPNDPFKFNATGLESPAQNFGQATLSDSEDLADLPRFIVAGGPGVITMVGANGVTVAVPVQAGQLLPVRPTRIKNTGTTATPVLLFW